MMVLRATPSAVQEAVVKVWRPKINLEAAEFDTPGKLIEITGDEDKDNKANTEDRNFFILMIDQLIQYWTCLLVSLWHGLMISL